MRVRVITEPEWQARHLPCHLWVLRVPKIRQQSPGSRVELEMPEERARAIVEFFVCFTTQQIIHSVDSSRE